MLPLWAVPEFLVKLQDDIYLNFIKENRWKYLVEGLGVTLRVTFFAVLIGIALGFLVAIIRSTHDKVGTVSTFTKFVLEVLNFVCNLYLTIIRGTPVVVQLLIIYFVIFGSVRIDKVLVAILAFGINSGAYVAEIVRGGIMSVEKGQTEAGRSLGLSGFRTMMYIVLPQAAKSALPAMCNEFISLIKETSVLSYIALTELTKAGDYIRSRTFSAFTPYIVSGLLYLIVTLTLTTLIGKLERRLRNSDH